VPQFLRSSLEACGCLDFLMRVLEQKLLQCSLLHSYIIIYQATIMVRLLFQLQQSSLQHTQRIHLSSPCRREMMCQSFALHNALNHSQFEIGKTSIDAHNAGKIRGLHLLHLFCHLASCKHQSLVPTTALCCQCHHQRRIFWWHWVDLSTMNLPPWAMIASCHLMLGTDCHHLHLQSTELVLDPWCWRRCSLFPAGQ